MYKEILSLKLNRNPGYSNPSSICVFIVEDHLSISEDEKEMILDKGYTKSKESRHTQLTINDFDFFKLGDFD